MATDYTKCSIGFASGNAFDNLATALSFFDNLLDYMWLEFKNGDNAVKYEQLGEALSGMLEMLKVSGLMPND